MSNNPPGIPRFNALTRDMDMVSQYNQTYVPRAFGGQGVPDAEFVPKPQEVPLQQPMMQPPTPLPQTISQEEAQRRLLAWAAESGQVLNPVTGNVDARVPVQPPVQQYRPMQAPYGTNPGVLRDPRYSEVPMPGYPYHPGGMAPPNYGPPPQSAREFPPLAQVPPRASLTPMSGIQSIQSIDLERSVVWADGTPFSFDPREAQPVLQFALEVILRQFSTQFGALLQRYGLVQSMPGKTAPVHVPPGQQQALGDQELLQAVPRGDAAGVPQPGAVPQQVPAADASGSADGAGSSAQAS